MADHDVTLPDVNAEDMNADLTLSRCLAPLRTEVASLLQRIDDTILEAEAETWYATTAGYTALVRLSKHDAKLQSELAPAVSFFRLGKRAPKTQAPAK